MPATAPAAYTQLRVRVKGRAFVSTLFARAHVSRADDAELPAGRTLFLLNVTPHIAPASLAAAFEARAGEVTSIRMGEGVGAHSAHVIFAKPAALKKLLATTKPLDLTRESPSSSSSSGLSAALPSREELQGSVAEFMQRFEADEAARRAAEDARHNQMDGDGFVVVTRKRTGRSTSTDASGATVGVASAQPAADDDAEGAEGESGGARKKKKKQKEMADFYHFQQHERKREGLMKLREQFEQDKERIARMRADRKFKPQGYKTEL